MTTVRDASRIRLFLPDIDVDSDGSYADDNNEAYICVTGNVSWSGFKRQSIKTTCTETPVDGWGNIIHTFRAGRFIDMGTLTFDVDFNPDTEDIANAAFRQTGNRNYEVRFPAEVGETTGPIIIIPGHFTDFTPITDAMAEGDNSRSRVTLVMKIAGDWTITDAV
jgi:hypothetical protein